MNTYQVTAVESPKLPARSFLVGFEEDIQMIKFVSQKVSGGPHGCYMRVDLHECPVTLYANNVRGRLCVDMIPDDTIDMSEYAEVANAVIQKQLVK